jgi:type 1 fimbria pilin
MRLRNFRWAIGGLLVAAALAAMLVSMATLVLAQGKITVTGVVTDSMCPTGDHSHMQMGPTDGECTIACVMEHGAEFVVYDGKDVYTLSDQKAPEQFAGKRVTVVGTLDAKAKKIQVESIAAAK